MGVDINERAFRQFVAEFNELYESGNTEMFIAHSNKGYKLTTSTEEIELSLVDDYKRAKKMLKRYWRCKKAKADKQQITFMPAELNEYEVVMKMEV